MVKAGMGVLYRNFGRTGLRTSVIGMGGMRFRAEDLDRGDLDACADVMVHAYEKGVNYFDTAPKYCNDRSLEVFARGLRQMDREKVFVTSKASPDNTGEQTADELLRSIERHLERLGTDYIDFFHLWCVLSLDMFRRYERMGIVDGILRARDRGLVRHVSVSTHAGGADVEKILESGYFEGCLLNYNAFNFSFRQRALDAAARLGVGIVTMNPLGGGLIPQNPAFFSFLKAGPEDTVSKAAVRFNASHPQVNVVLVGASQKEHIDEACDALEGLHAATDGALCGLKSHISRCMDGFCTMCGYCEQSCPASLPIPKLMDGYNHYLLKGRESRELLRRLDVHWDLSGGAAERCAGCGACEARCTQRLPISTRMREIAGMAAAQARQ